MNKRKLVVAAKVQGELQAELMRGLLKAQGISAMLASEGAARAIGLTVGPLSEIEILVPEEKIQAALDVITRYRNGEFEDDIQD
ncbi:MAG: DUF2007 domain-containing protein [Chloroflexota bacterium]|nr:DUF2007 domain-containing protein [Chloroflexota bacterium]